MKIETIIEVAKQAGELIMQLYERPVVVTDKKDNSPLTEADLRSHGHIVSALHRLTPDTPVLSEESSEKEAKDRLSWGRYWLIDPLDGTKEFIKHNGEFTVNIALVENGVPVLGVVHAPALNVTYWGQSGKGAFKASGDGVAARIHVSPVPEIGQCWRVVGSRSHQSPEFDRFLQSLPVHELVSMGSSLKLCLVAEGKADLYPRLGFTSEWDTAAAQAVVEAAGGKVHVWPDMTPLRYNQRPETLLNPHFIVCSEAHQQWLGDKVLSDGIVYEYRENDSKADVVWHSTQVTKDMRVRSLGQAPKCVWLTGLSGSGKSTIANALELALHNAGKHTFLLDGDNVRHGLNKDLGMNDADRAENIRRVGEVAKLMVDAGLIVVTAFISPFRKDRDQVRAMFEPGEFVEVFIDTPLQECERRDPKGLYQKAREGKIKDFTGIDSPYEAPEKSDITLHTHKQSVDECVNILMAFLARTVFEGSSASSEDS